MTDSLVAREVLPNVQDEPRPWLARAVLLGARIVTAMVVGSGALLGFSFIVEERSTARSSPRIRRSPRAARQEIAQAPLDAYRSQQISDRSFPDSRRPIRYSRL